MKIKIITLFFLSIFLQCKANEPLMMLAEGHDVNKQMIPIGGNSWTMNGGDITEKGLVDWGNKQTVCRTYCF